MKIPDNFNYAQSYTAPSKPSQSKNGSQLSDFASLTDFGSTKNTIFQNLLKDESVQEDVTLNNDGTYTFHFNDSDGPLNDHQFLAKMLISEQNDAPVGLEGPPFSTVDRERFRQVTGYNFVQAGGLYTIVDDNGDVPPASEEAMVKAASFAFMNARDVQILRGQTGNITAASLAEMIKNMGTVPGADAKMLDALMAVIDKSFSDELSNSEPV